VTATDGRLELARQWLDGHLAHDCSIESLAGDASFRRYFRVRHEDRTWVLMDAPPGKEDVGPFLSVRQWMQEAGLHVPQLLAADRQAGFLLLDDFGDETWAAALKRGMALAPLMSDALDQLHRLQADGTTDGLPVFDAARMHREADLYLDWYLPKVAGIEPDDAGRQAFHAALAPLVEEIAALPQVAVHLDYHSRNLMLPPDGLPLGVIDFQDAVLGPVTYDLASLLYDCYQDYPEEERRYWSLRFFDGLPTDRGQAFGGDGERWHRAVRLTAFQRHIKAIGIFARLAYRDGKRQFLDEIPLTRKHIREEVRALGLLVPLGLEGR
jgi:N-acetylmuramate 1-kinase